MGQGIVETTEKADRLAAEILRIKAEGREDGTLSKVANLLGRIVVRCVRIAIGFAISFGAIWTGIEAFEIASQPLASLTILKILGFLILAGLTYLVGAIALVVAFGEGEAEDVKRKKTDDAIRREAQERIWNQDQQEATRQRDLRQREWLNTQARKAGRFIASLRKRWKRA